MVKLEEPLKEGDWPVSLSLGYDIEAKIQVLIVPQSAAKR